MHPTDGYEGETTILQFIKPLSVLTQSACDIFQNIFL